MDTLEKLEFLKKWHTKRRDADFILYPTLGTRGAEPGFAIRLKTYKKVFSGELDEVLQKAIDFLTSA